MFRILCFGLWPVYIFLLLVMGYIRDAVRSPSPIVDIFMCENVATNYEFLTAAQVYKQIRIGIQVSKPKLTHNCFKFNFEASYLHI